MYNEKNPLYSSFPKRDIPPRALSGRSRPTFANLTNEEQVIPRIDDESGRRLCDGSLRQDRTAPRNDNNHGNCGDSNYGCGEKDGGWGLSSYPLASVYSPLQEFRQLYDEEKALERGTLFAELDLPFEGEKGGCKLC